MKYRKSEHLIFKPIVLNLLLKMKYIQNVFFCTIITLTETETRTFSETWKKLEIIQYSEVLSLMRDNNPVNKIDFIEKFRTHKRKS